MDTQIIELRNRARTLGLRLHRRGEWYRLIEGRYGYGSADTLAGIATLLDVREGKLVIEYDGRIVEKETA
jgi:hypothetical protein